MFSNHNVTLKPPDSHSTSENNGDDVLAPAPKVESVYFQLIKLNF